MPVKIFETDSSTEIATKIFYEFEVDQSCTVEGFVILTDSNDLPEPKLKGDLVLQELERIDSLINRDKMGRRRRKKLENSIGGFVAEKVFRYKHRDLNKVDIWRIQ